MTAAPDHLGRAAIWLSLWLALFLALWLALCVTLWLTRSVPCDTPLALLPTICAPWHSGGLGFGVQ